MQFKNVSNITHWVSRCFRCAEPAKMGRGPVTSFGVSDKNKWSERWPICYSHTTRPPSKSTRWCSVLRIQNAAFDKTSTREKFAPKKRNAILSLLLLYTSSENSWVSFPAYNRTARRGNGGVRVKRRPTSNFTFLEHRCNLFTWLVHQCCQVDI